MLRRETFWLAVILGCAVLSGMSRASAQDTGAAPKSAAQPDSAAEGTNKSAKLPEEGYHLEFSINEIEDGKKINSRQYSANLTTIKPSEIKIGARVPVEVKEGEFQYMDVGTNIFAQVREIREQSALVVEAELSSFAAPDASQGKRDLGPVVRQLKMSGSVLLPLTKTVVMGTADDPNSKRQFQLEVTMTKLR